MLLGDVGPGLTLSFHFQRGLASQGLGQAAPGEPISGGRVPLQVGIQKCGGGQADKLMEAGAPGLPFRPPKRVERGVWGEGGTSGPWPSSLKKLILPPPRAPLAAAPLE